MDNLITTLAELEQLYGDVGEASIRKEIDYLHPLYQSIIQASPFAVLATSGRAGLDTSPRGDAPGFIKILNEKTLLLPDRRGNNRIDSLRNIIEDPRVALLFLVPGLGETLRVNGQAKISTDPTLLDQFSVDGKLPKTLLVIQVESAFFQCSRAIRRSHLWDFEKPDISHLPTAGQILAALTHDEIDGIKYDKELPERIKQTLY